jgi:hypothetical protein
MKHTVISTLLSVVVLSLLCVAQGSDYRRGKIVSVHKLQSNSQPDSQADSVGQTDAPLKREAVKYEIVIDAGGSSYTCEYLAQSDLDPSWAEGKEVQVRVKERMVYIKTASGKDEGLLIVSTKPIGGSEPTGKVQHAALFYWLWRSVTPTPGIF